jgi:hypothetical protein
LSPPKFVTFLSSNDAYAFLELKNSLLRIQYFDPYAMLHNIAAGVERRELLSLDPETLLSVEVNMLSLVHKPDASNNDEIMNIRRQISCAHDRVNLLCIGAAVTSSTLCDTNELSLRFDRAEVETVVSLASYLPVSEKATPTRTASSVGMILYAHVDWMW